MKEHDTSTSPDCEHNGRRGLKCSEEQNVTAEQVIIHENYNEPCQECNDIALIRLNKKIVFDYGKTKKNFLQVKSRIETGYYHP